MRLVGAAVRSLVYMCVRVNHRPGLLGWAAPQVGGPHQSSRKRGGRREHCFAMATVKASPAGATTGMPEGRSCPPRVPAAHHPGKCARQGRGITGRRRPPFQPPVCVCVYVMPVPSSTPHLQTPHHRTFTYAVCVITCLDCTTSTTIPQSRARDDRRPPAPPQAYYLREAP